MGSKEMQVHRSLVDTYLFMYVFGIVSVSFAASMNHFCQDTLLQVHVIFRHGDKTPDKSLLYPNDPYKDENYHPYGHGQLTDKGKETVRELGKILREKYKGFLGETYHPGLLDPWTSEKNRCKATLELVLAALFPPPTKSKQPIAYKSCEKMFLAILYNPVAVKAYEEYLEGEGKHFIESRSDVLRYVEQNSGLTITTIRQAALLANTLLSQDNMELPLPVWTKKIWPDAVMDFLKCEFDIITSTARMKYFTVGMLLEKMIEDSKLKIDGKSQCKMHLYSGHDITLSALLHCLGAKDQVLPSYGANLIFELHNFNDVFGYKIYYQWNPKHEAELLVLDGGRSFYSFEDFVKLSQDILDQKQLNPDF